MGYRTNRYKGKELRYLRCNGYQMRGRSFCNPASMREDHLLPTVLGVMRDRLRDPSHADRLRGSDATGSQQGRAERIGPSAAGAGDTRRRHRQGAAAGGRGRYRHAQYRAGSSSQAARAAQRCRGSGAVARIILRGNRD
ncbi:MAG: hypothetical protein H0T47_05380 [Planctomycetaceae bacterium]|nr:hypothetical protein [Planctomycetaceae bacterium]